MPKADALRARDNDGPYLGATFRVRISGTASARRGAGLPVSRVEWGPVPVVPRDVPATPAIGTGAVLPDGHVLLCRGVTEDAKVEIPWDRLFA